MCPGTVSNIQHRDIDVPEVAADEIGEDVEDDPVRGTCLYWHL